MPSLRPSGAILRRPADSLTSSGGLFRKAMSTPTVVRKVRVTSRSPSPRPEARMGARGLRRALRAAASSRKTRPVATSASPQVAVPNLAPAQSKLVPGVVELVTYTRMALAAFAARLLHQCHLGLGASTLSGQAPGEVPGPKTAEDGRIAEVRAASVGIAWLQAASELAGRFYEAALVWFDKLPGPASGKYIAVLLFAFLLAIAIYLKRSKGISMAAAQAWEGMDEGSTEDDFTQDLRKGETERMLEVALHYAAALKQQQASSAVVEAADRASAEVKDTEMVVGEEEVMVPALGASGGRGAEGSGGAEGGRGGGSNSGFSSTSSSGAGSGTAVSQLAQAKAAEEARVKQLAQAKAAEQERVKQLAKAKAAEEAGKLSEEVKQLAKEKAAEEERMKRLVQENVSEEERAEQLAQMKAADLAQEKAAEEARVKQLAQMRAAEEERMVALAKERAAEEAQRLSEEVKQLAKAKAAEEAQQAALAQERAAEEAQQAALAKEKAAEEAQQAALAQEKAAEEARVEQLAQLKAAEEERMVALAKERAAEEAQQAALAQEKAAEEARVEQLAQLKAAEEERMVALAKERAAEEAQKAALAQEKAAEEAESASGATRGDETWQNAFKKGADMKTTADAKIRKRQAEEAHATVKSAEEERDRLPAEERPTSNGGAETGELQANTERTPATEEANAEGEMAGVMPEGDKSKEAVAQMKASETKRMLAVARERAARLERPAGKEEAAAGDKRMAESEEAEGRQVDSAELPSAEAAQPQKPPRIEELTVARSAAAAEANILGLAMGAARGYDLRRQKLQHVLCDASKGLTIIAQRRSERREFLLRFLNKKLEPRGSDKPVEIVPPAVSDLARWVETSPSPPDYSFEGKWKVLYSTDEMLLRGSGDSTYYCAGSSEEGAEQVKMENAVSFSFNFNFDMEFSRTAGSADAVVTLSRKLSGRPDEALVKNGASAAPQICSAQTCSEGGALEVHYVDQYVCIARRAQQKEKLTILASKKPERVQTPQRSNRKGNMAKEQAEETAASSMPTPVKSETVFFSEEELKRMR
ncbi:hypothetical protein CYMTET_27601 [Cymbomonas tetramitiformis]|uniref:Uncharacterized protein n=1 Tax=Cymbomonas tetramitiformis TaxID=36881 RepID=A0AAE0FPG2_9CHLO|nr:hypothetical protein CYMTET_27601 [Cymbomonas tetramitiformis]